MMHAKTECIWTERSKIFSAWSKLRLVGIYLLWKVSPFTTEITVAQWRFLLLQIILLTYADMHPIRMQRDNTFSFLKTLAIIYKLLKWYSIVNRKIQNKREKLSLDVIIDKPAELPHILGFTSFAVASRDTPLHLIPLRPW